MKQSSTCHLWNCKTGNERPTLRAHARALLCVLPTLRLCVKSLSTSPQHKKEPARRLQSKATPQAPPLVNSDGTNPGQSAFETDTRKGLEFCPRSWGRRMRTILNLLLLLCCLTTRAFAADTNRKDVVVWYTSHACQESFALGTPGSTPELAIRLEDFEEVYYEASRGKEDLPSKPPSPSKFECKWVELSGFFSWLDYYHYRGQLVSGFLDFYPMSKVRYIVERFSDSSMRRAALARKRVTLVGRFYDLCAAADRDRLSSKDNWMMVLGPCHYGANNGMMLTDVRVKSVEDKQPRYLLGDTYRDILGNLYPVDGTEAGTLEVVTRQWASSVQRGANAYANETFARDPSWRSRKQAEIEEARRNISDADSYSAYLRGNSAFMQRDMTKTQVSVFWEGKTQVEERRIAWGCVCLLDECKDRFPLFSSDASHFLGDAACKQLEWSKQAARWLW